MPPRGTKRLAGPPTDDDDEPITMSQAQGTIQKLKDTRQKRLDQVVSEAKAALVDLEKKLITIQQQAKKQKAKEQARIVKQIIESVQKRKELEEEMMNEVEKTNELIEHMDDLLEVGFEGREKDALQYVPKGKSAEKKPAQEARSSRSRR